MALAEHLWSRCQVTEESVRWLCEHLKEAGVDIEHEELSGESPRQKAVRLVFQCQAKEALQILADILSGRDAQKSNLEAVRRITQMLTF